MRSGVGEAALSRFFCPGREVDARGASYAASALSCRAEESIQVAGEDLEKLEQV